MVNMAPTHFPARVYGCKLNSFQTLVRFQSSYTVSDVNNLSIGTETYTRGTGKVQEKRPRVRASVYGTRD